MTSNKATSSAGFTIIELLIVLAMAGIILSLVLMAIPALQRSGRNNQRRQDVQEILQEVSHYELNNSGDIPKSTDLQLALNNAPRKLTYYDSNDPAAITVQLTLLGHTQNISSNNNLDKVVIYNHAKCDPSNPGNAVSTGAGYNDVTAMFAIEAASGPTPQCQNL